MKLPAVLDFTERDTKSNCLESVTPNSGIDLTRFIFLLRQPPASDGIVIGVRATGSRPFSHARRASLKSQLEQCTSSGALSDLSIKKAPVDDRGQFIRPPRTNKRTLQGFFRVRGRGPLATARFRPTGLRGYGGRPGRGRLYVFLPFDLSKTGLQ